MMQPWTSNVQGSTALVIICSVSPISPQCLTSSQNEKEDQAGG